MSLLVTGHKGFVGGHLMAATQINGLCEPDGAFVDLLDLPAVKRAVERSQPTAVLHMAAQSAVPDSFRDPAATYHANFIGTQNLITALQSIRFAGRFLYISSAEVYGAVDESVLPVSETALLKPLNPYAVSKVAAELLCSYQHLVEGMQIIVARPFNHIGPGQSTRFAIADFAKSIVEMRLGLKPPVLRVGDLDVTRDFTDVRDVVRAYLLLLEKGLPGEVYNVCSGKERHIDEAVKTLAALAGVELTLEVEPNRLRKAGQRRTCGDASKLRAHTGWTPQIEWRISLMDILEDWEHQLV